MNNRHNPEPVVPLVNESLITGQKQNEKALRESEAQIAADLTGMRRLYELQSKLADEHDLEAALQEVLVVACEFTGTDRGCVQLLSDDGERLEMFVWQGYTNESPFICFFRYEGLEMGCEVARVQRQRMIIEDTVGFAGLEGTDAGVAAHADGIRASQSTPLANRSGETIGVLSTQFRQPHRPSDHELRLIDMLAWTAAQYFERHRADAALRESEERMRRALSIETVGVLFFGLDGRIHDANAAFQRMCGYTVEELRTTAHWKKLTAPEFIEPTMRSAQNLAERGETPPYEKMMIRPDGTRWWGLFAPTQLSGSGLNSECLEFIIDITEARATQEELRQSEEKYRQLFNSIDEGFCVIEVFYDENKKPVDFVYLETNPVFEVQSGLENVIGRSIRKMIPTLDQFWYDVYGKVALTGQSVRLEHEVVELNRKYDIFASKVGDDSSRKVGIIFRDISARKRTEANQAFLAEIADELSRLSTAEQIMETVGAKIGAYLQVKSCLFVDVDDARGEVTVFDAWSAADVPSLRYQTIRLSDFINEEFSCANRKGEGVIVRDTNIDPRSEGGDYTALGLGAFVTVPFHRNGVWTNYLALTDSQPRDWRNDEIELFREVSNRIFPRLERARAEAALIEREERLRFLVEGTQDYAMFLMDPQRRIFHWNSGAESLFGWSRDEMIGQSGDIIFTPEDRAKGDPEKEAEEAARTTSAPNTRWHLRKDGSRFWSDGRNTALHNEAGEVLGFSKILRDATKEKAAEEALKQAHDELERRVQKRTAQLRSEIAQRQEAEHARERLLQRLVNAQEEERRRISREMHDEMGQQLTALLLGLSALSKTDEPARGLSADHQTIQRLQGLANDVMKQMHRLAWELRPAALDSFGLEPALRRYVQQWSEHSNVEVDFLSRGIAGGEDSLKPSSSRLPPQVETVLYRVVQEALTNVQRHAEAKNVSVVLERRSQDVIATVEDDGRGFEVEEDETGRLRPSAERLGLLGMMERLELVNGTLSVESAPGQGTTVYARVTIE
ncbi:MAG TPA: PAS domain S-box protein [Abditibacteriaceae bacterium]|jgi:PAS domain S-box-containing protein